MPQLDSRQAQIMHALLAAEGPLPAAKLGKQVDLSARMVRYNLPMLESWLAARGLSLTTQPRTGVFIEASPEARRKLKSELEGERITPSYSAEERQLLLVFELLARGDFIANPELEALISVSHTTLARDLEAAEAWLSARHVYLKRKPQHGLAVAGREDDLRHTLVSLILEVCSEMALIDIYLWGKKVKNIQGVIPHSIPAIILDRISEWNFSFAWRYISQIENLLDFTLADRDHLFLAMYWMVMVRRLRMGLPIEMPQENISYLSSLPEYQAVQEIAARYYQETGLAIPEAELAQLSIELSTSLRQAQSMVALTCPPANNGDQPLPSGFVEALVARVGEQTGFTLAHRDAIQRLKEHLQRSLTRLQYGMPISNPLTAQVHNTYPELWQITQEVFHGFEKQAGVSIPPEETAYITMYMVLAFDIKQKRGSRKTPRVVVACPSGGVTVWMLVSRLRSELPEVEIVDIVSMRELNRVGESSADAIISTADFRSRALPVITVTPFVHPHEVARIKLELDILD